MKDFIIRILTMVILFSIIIIPSIIIEYTGYEKIDIEVKEKYVKGQEGKYMVVDTEGSTYEITDLMFKGKFNSSDIYSKIEINHRYEVELTGHRIPFLSQYKNINKIQEIKEEN